MKKNLLSVLFIIAVFVTYAQKTQQKVKKTPEERAEALTQKMTAHLALTEEQVPKIKALNLDKAQKVEAVRAKYGTAKNKKGMGGEIQKIRQDWEVQLKTTLTPEQFTKYEQKREEIKKKRQEKKQQAKQNQAQKKPKPEEAEEEDLYLDETE